MARTASARLTGFGSHSQRPPEQRIIDLVHLAKQTLGDRGLENEVLRLFDQSAGAYFERVKTARSAEELKICLHSLKGASAGVGANGLAQAARHAEVEYRETGEVSAETVADIGFAVEEVRAFISDLLKD